MNSEASTSVVWESAAAAMAVGGGVHASTPTRHRGASSCSSSSSSSSGNSGSGTSSLLVRIARIIMKRKRNGYLMRLTQQSGKREKQKAKTRNDIKS